MNLGLSWASATTEGVLIYGLNSGFVFDPFQLEIGITPIKTRETLSKKEYASGKFNCYKSIHFVVFIKCLFFSSNDGIAS